MLRLAPALALRRLDLDEPDVAVEHRLEPLDDVALVGEAAAEQPLPAGGASPGQGTAARSPDGDGRADGYRDVKRADCLSRVRAEHAD